MLVNSSIVEIEELRIRFSSGSVLDLSKHEFIYGSESYLNALIQGSGSKGSFLRPEIFLGEELLAWGCFQELVLYREDLNELGRLFGSDSKFSLRLEALFKLLVHIGNGRKGIRILIAGNTQVSGPYGVFFKPDVNEELKARIWSEVLKTCDALRGPYSIILAKEFYQSQNEIVERFKKNGYRAIQSLPIMTMKLEKDWASFEDYLAALSSKYRIRAKAARKKGEKVKRIIWGVEEIRARAKEIYSLYNNVYEKARFRLFKIEENYFSALKTNLRDSIIFQAYLLDDKLIGFSTLVLHESHADAHLIGLDYEANKQFSVYQNILYDYIEAAIDRGIHKIDFGRTAMEIKSTVGAVPEEMKVMVKIRNTLLDSVTCILMENSSPRKWIQRHPFKEE